MDEKLPSSLRKFLKVRIIIIIIIIIIITIIIIIATTLFQEDKNTLQFKTDEPVALYKHVTYYI